MPPPSILTDDLLRQLVAVGQVDILVGIPSLNHADSIGNAVRAVHAAFDRVFHRERTVLVNSDGGSSDGTPDVVRSAAIGESGTLSVSHSLRTLHRVSAPYHGQPGKGSAVRVLFAAGDLLQARAVVVLDPDVTSITPEWVTALARPILAGDCDFVAPLYARHPLEGPLVTQLLRPLVRATYGARLQEPVGGEFGCSGRFARHALSQPHWDAEWARNLPDLWLAGLAIASRLPAGQAALGQRQVAPRASRPGLPEVFRQVVGAAFHGLEVYAPQWLERSGSEPIRTFGEPGPPDGEPPTLDADSMGAAFRDGVADLSPLLEPVLTSETLEAVRALAARSEPPAFGDALWARTVYEFLAAHHHGVMHSEHVLQALVPLYLGRTAGFVARGAREPAAIEAELEALSLEFERAKPELIRRWNPERGR